jgi:hypothetical protein
MRSDEAWRGSEGYDVTRMGGDRPLRRSRAGSLETDRNAAPYKPTVGDVRDWENEEQQGVREELKPVPESE